MKQLFLLPLLLSFSLNSYAGKNKGIPPGCEAAVTEAVTGKPLKAQFEKNDQVRGVQIVPKQMPADTATKAEKEKAAIELVRKNLGQVARMDRNLKDIKEGESILQVHVLPNDFGSIQVEYAPKRINNQLVFKMSSIELHRKGNPNPITLAKDPLIDEGTALRKAHFLWVVKQKDGQDIETKVVKEKKIEKITDKLKKRGLAPEDSTEADILANLQRAATGLDPTDQAALAKLLKKIPTLYLPLEIGGNVLEAFYDLSTKYGKYIEPSETAALNTRSDVRKLYRTTLLPRMVWRNTFGGIKKYKRKIIWSTFQIIGMGLIAGAVGIGYESFNPVHYLKLPKGKNVAEYRIEQVPVAPGEQALEGSEDASAKAAATQNLNIVLDRILPNQPGSLPNITKGKRDFQQAMARVAKDKPSDIVSIIASPDAAEIAKLADFGKNPVTSIPGNDDKNPVHFAVVMSEQNRAIAIVSLAYDGKDEDKDPKFATTLIDAGIHADLYGKVREWLLETTGSRQVVDVQ